MKNYSVIEKINNNIIRVRRTNNKLVVKSKFIYWFFLIFFIKRNISEIYIIYGCKTYKFCIQRRDIYVANVRITEIKRMLRTSTKSRINKRGIAVIG